MRCCTGGVILTSPSTGWPPRRLPSRTRLLRIRIARLRAAVDPRKRQGRMRQGRQHQGRQPRLRRPAVVAGHLLLLVRRLALWTTWLGVTGALFLAVDLHL